MAAGGLEAAPALRGVTSPQVYLYHLTSGKQLHSFNASEVPVCAVAFTDDGKFLACGSADGSSAVYDIAR